MKRNELRYAIKDSWRSMARHPLVLVASVTTLTLMLLLMSFYVAFTLNARHLVEIAGQQPPIEIRMAIGVSRQQLIEMDAVLAADECVIDFTHYSPEENLERFKRDMGKEELFEEEGLVDILPHTYIIRLTDPGLAESFKTTYMNMPGVYSVIMEKALMEALREITKTVTRIGLIVFAALAVISSFVVSNMIRVSILSRASEIGIMKYVGATNMYVRIPFVIEGGVAGIVSAFVSTLVSGLIYNRLNRPAAGSTSVFGRLSHEFSLLPTSRIVGLMLILNLVIGLTVSVVASALSVRRYIKV
jgi:cell division transport system permease protein